MNKFNTLSVILTNGNRITNSQEFQGLSTMFKEGFQAILVAATFITPFALAVCFLRKMNADEQDQKKWKDRIMLIIYCYIGLFFITGGLILVEGYLKAKP